LQANGFYKQATTGLGEEFTENTYREIDISANPFTIPVQKLSHQLAIVQTKVKKLNATNPNKILKLTPDESDLLHMVPISEMGNYQNSMTKYSKLRDPLEDESEVLAREKNLFGNPYRKAPKKQSSIGMARSDSQDSIAESLNEEEEEASHEFNIAVNLNSNEKRRKMFKISKTIPPLAQNCIIYIPDFKHFDWKQAQSIDYDKIIATLKYNQIDAIAAELENISDLNEMDIASTSEPHLLTFSETDADSVIAESPANIDTDIPMDVDHSIVALGSSISWKNQRKQFYDMISVWPQGIVRLIRF
jgi:hypothetical protein